MTQPVDFTADAIKDLSDIASYTAQGKTVNMILATFHARQF